MSAAFFWLGFSIRCEPTVPGDFAKVTKNDTEENHFFLFGYIFMSNLAES